MVTAPTVPPGDCSRPDITQPPLFFHDNKFMQLLWDFANDEHPALQAVGDPAPDPVGWYGIGVRFYLAGSLSPSVDFLEF
jgi:hypothetical protein